jgi:hypothetical protein
VDKKRNGRRLWEGELFSLKDRIPLSNYGYASKIKEKLAPAHAELMEKGFLKGVTYRKSENNEFASYEISEGFHARRSVGVLERPSGDEFFCVQRLRAEGMGANAAEELVAKHGTERCLRYAEAVAYQKNIRNRAGWLRWALEHAPELDLPAAPAAATISTQRPQPAVEATTEDIEKEPVLPPVSDPCAQEVWDLLFEELSQQINTPSLLVWFEGMVPTAFEGSTLVLRVPNRIALEYIETRFGELIRKMLKEQVGPDGTIVVQAPDGTSSADYASQSS